MSSGVSAAGVSVFVEVRRRDVFFAGWGAVTGASFSEAGSGVAGSSAAAAVFRRVRAGFFPLSEASAAETSVSAFLLLEERLLAVAFFDVEAVLLRVVVLRLAAGASSSTTGVSSGATTVALAVLLRVRFAGFLAGDAGASSSEVTVSSGCAFTLLRRVVLLVFSVVDSSSAGAAADGVAVFFFVLVVARRRVAVFFAGVAASSCTVPSSGRSVSTSVPVWGVFAREGDVFRVRLVLLRVLDGPEDGLLLK